jgi:hypothetical protein
MGKHTDLIAQFPGREKQIEQLKSATYGVQ